MCCRVGSTCRCLRAPGGRWGAEGLCPCCAPGRAQPSRLRASEPGGWEPFPRSPLSVTEWHRPCSPHQTAGKHGWGRQWGKGGGPGPGQGLEGTCPAPAWQASPMGCPEGRPGESSEHGMPLLVLPLSREMLFAQPGFIFPQPWVSGTEQWAPEGRRQVLGARVWPQALVHPSSSSSIRWDRPPQVAGPVPAAFGDCPKATPKPSCMPVPALPRSHRLSSLGWAMSRVQRRGHILHHAG